MKRSPRGGIASRGRRSNPTTGASLGVAKIPPRPIINPNGCQAQGRRQGRDTMTTSGAWIGVDICKKYLDVAATAGTPVRVDQRRRRAAQRWRAVSRADERAWRDRRGHRRARTRARPGPRGRGRARRRSSILPACASSPKAPASSPRRTGSMPSILARLWAYMKPARRRCWPTLTRQKLAPFASPLSLPDHSENHCPLGADSGSNPHWAWLSSAPRRRSRRCAQNARRSSARYRRSSSRRTPGSLSQAPRRL